MAMMQTPELGLNLPGDSDWADQRVFNDNFSRIDAAHHDMETDQQLHRDDRTNPHQVTAAQAGAEPLGAVRAHNASQAAHGDLRGQVSRNTTEIEALKQALVTDINKNPFSVSFGSLDGVSMTGVWNQPQARIDF